MGDHNFPDLAQFALAAYSEETTRKPTLANLLNPIGSSPISTTPRTNFELDSSNTHPEPISSYSGLVDPVSETSSMVVDSTGGDDKKAVVSKRGEIEEMVKRGGKAKAHKETLLSYFHRMGSVPKSVPAKRAHSELDDLASEDTDNPVDGESKQHRKTKKTSGNWAKVPVFGPVGLSRSAQSSKKTRDAAARGEFIWSDKKLESWREKLVANDADVEFDKTDLCKVRHSSCGKWFKVKEPYDSTRWCSHLKKCTVVGGHEGGHTTSGRKRTLKSTAGTPTLEKMASTFGWTEKMPPAIGCGRSQEADAEGPCPGLQDVDHKLVPVYLRRTGAMGGGARSVIVIAKESFGQLFSSLSKKEQVVVKDSQAHEHQWRNDHRNLRVFATKCKQTVLSPSTGRRLPCFECISLLSNHRFTAILQKKTPTEENAIYTNRQWQNQIIGEHYARIKGLKDIIETAVSRFLDKCHIVISCTIPGCEKYTLYYICKRRALWQV